MTMFCTCAISSERLAHVVSKVKVVLADGNIHKKKLESLLGLLSFCAQVIYGGRPYLQSGFKLLAKTINTQFASDLKWWVKSVAMANGKVVNTGQFPTIPLNCASLDASREWGMGGFWMVTGFK
mmetsp:Transcript_23028/g.31980  ORF Transcript_23028/g.31980 Transcript_23028/m.31980 type:complete len:124 (-) Transcript_23028:827-1198(-)